MPALDPWIQAGALGIVGFIVAWFLLKGVPLLLSARKDDITAMMQLFIRETDECRKERDKDREYRHEQAQILHASLGEVHLAVQEMLKVFRPEGARNNAG